MRYLNSPLRFFVFLLLTGFVPLVAGAQEFDYQPRPEFDYSFENAKINLRIHPQQVTLEGSVFYRLRADISGADTLVLNAPGITIDSVKSHGQNLAFVHKNQYLKIALTDSSQRGSKYSVKIYYKASPNFGLLKSSEGTIWTSMLPRATRHWLPVRDNPRTRMTVTLSMRVPDNFKVFASGISRGKHMYPDSTKKITFRTGNAIPITTLTFGVGHFHGINSFAEPNSISAAEQRKLVKKTKQIIQEIKKVTGMGYPFQRVTLAILKDDHWETKAYGASTIFLYKNRGAWMKQLRRGLCAQWVGVYLNEGRWAGSWPIRFMQTALLNRITGSGVPVNMSGGELQPPFSTVYNHFGVANWRKWQQSRIWSLPNPKHIVLDVMRSLLEIGPVTITPAMFKTIWYKVSGRTGPDVPFYPPQMVSNHRTTERNAVHYQVNFDLNAQTNTLELTFKTDSTSLQQPVMFTAIIKSDSVNRTKNIGVKGELDSVSISLPRGTQNVRLHVLNRKK